MNLKIEFTEKDLKDLIIEHLKTNYNVKFDPGFLSIKVRSKQNFKSEWETASFKAIYEENKV